MYIRSLSDCNEARKNLGISIWKDEKRNKDTARLPYCWIGGSGAANYNANGDWGSRGLVVSKLICQKYGEFCFI